MNYQWVLTLQFVIPGRGTAIVTDYGTIPVPPGSSRKAVLEHLRQGAHERRGISSSDILFFSLEPEDL